MSDKAPPPTTSSAGTHTPGWNDPPNLQYNPLSNAPGKTKLNLNKRIAFPLQGGPTTSKPTAIVQPNQANAPPLLPMTMPPLGVTPNQHPVAVVHPMPNINAPPLSQPPTAAQTSAQTSPLQPPTQQQTFVEPLPDDAQQFALGILRLQLIKVQETPNVRLDEIQRRIGVMEELWQSGNLSQPIQAKIYKIAKAVETNSLAEAMETYTSLVLSHSNECSTWAVALRHIILTLQPNNARPLPSSVDEHQHNQTTTTSSASNSSSPQQQQQTATNCVLVPAMPRITNQPNDRVNPVQHI
ncbi:steroid receptor RNA activator 1 [Episyrphus balteatus]|uniref:steroid receptor RNA activator 1 n=1 Tax=Episyrphus balteatus TaxID=286459 RepID=UPI0024863669|nr:steroid receptor RNA activator 1 [Episyrphus balteatus]